jgi:colanic acid biosynthesis glycosyl transferase WcaI
MTSPRPHLLVITQVYPPDPAAVGQHLADVAEAMVAKGWRVTVLTANRGYDDPSLVYAPRECRRGVEIRRLSLSSFGKSSIAIRLLAQGLFMLQACALALFLPRITTVLASTSPPFAGAGAAIVARIRSARVVWWVMDLNPDQMIASGRITKTSLPARLFDLLNRFTLQTAAAVIVLDRFMRDRLAAKGRPRAPIAVIPPWAPDVSVKDSDPEAFRAAHGLTNSFLVMYSGNHALQHPLTTILDAARLLENDPTIAFVFIGGGAGKKAIDERIAAGARNIFSLPYQPLSAIGSSLGAADVHVVSMGNEMVGIVHPCKIYGILAAGKPVIYLGPLESHAGDILASHAIGWNVAHGDAAKAAAVIRGAYAASQGDRDVMGRCAAAAASAEYSRDTLIGQLCREIASNGTPDAPLAQHGSPPRANAGK